MGRKKTETDEVRTVVYCGPNLPKLGLRRYAIFKNGYPAHVKSAMEKVADLEKMMVPVEKLAKFRSETARAGSEPHRLYNQIKRERREL